MGPQSDKHCAGFERGTGALGVDIGVRVRVTIIIVFDEACHDCQCWCG